MRSGSAARLTACEAGPRRLPGSQARFARNHGVLVSTSRQGAVAHQQLRTPLPLAASGNMPTAPARNRDAPPLSAGFSCQAGGSRPSFARNHDARRPAHNLNPPSVNSCRRGLRRAAAWIRDGARVQPSLRAYPRPRSSLRPVLKSPRSSSCGAGARAPGPWFGTESGFRSTPRVVIRTRNERLVAE